MLPDAGGQQYSIKTNIIQGENGEHVGRPITVKTEVMTVDECLFLIRHDTWSKNYFSSNEGGHLYAVEYCLDMLDVGKRNYVVPIEVWHKSDGVSLDYLYCDQVLKLLEKYKDKYKYINTTVKQWTTSLYGRKIYIPYYRIKQKIKHFVKR